MIAVPVVNAVQALSWYAGSETGWTDTGHKWQCMEMRSKSGFNLGQNEGSGTGSTSHVEKRCRISQGNPNMNLIQKFLHIVAIGLVTCLTVFSSFEDARQNPEPTGCAEFISIEHEIRMIRNQRHRHKRWRSGSPLNTVPVSTFCEEVVANIKCGREHTDACSICEQIYATSTSGSENRQIIV